MYFYLRLFHLCALFQGRNWGVKQVLGVCSGRECNWKEKVEVLVEKYVPVPLCPQKKISTWTGLGSTPSLRSERHVRHSYINAVMSCASMSACYIIHVYVILITSAAVSPSLFHGTVDTPPASCSDFRRPGWIFPNLLSLLQARCSTVNEINDTTTPSFQVRSSVLFA